MSPARTQALICLRLNLSWAETAPRFGLCARVVLRETATLGGREGGIGGLESRRPAFCPWFPWSVIDVKGRLAPLADPQGVCVVCKMCLYGGATKVLAALHFQDSNQMPPVAHRLSTRFNPNRPSIRSSHHFDPTMWFAIHTTQDMSQHSP